MSLPDLDSPERVAAFVDDFYARLLADPRLQPIFIDVAKIDLPVHLPRIRAYWCKLLLGTPGYDRHTMNIHRAVHAQQSFTAADYQRWLTLFGATLDDRYRGPLADRAYRLASRIAGNMEQSLSGFCDETLLPRDE